MILKGIFLIILIIVFALVIFISFVMIFVRWKNKKSCLNWLAAFVFFIVLESATIIFGIAKAAPVAIDKSEKAAYTLWDKTALIISELFYSVSSDNRPIENVEWLKEYSPKDSVIPDTYWTYFGFRDFYRFPLVYPYSLHCIDTTEYGILSDETGIENISANPNDSKSLLSDIMSFSFDKNIMIGKRQSHSAFQPNEPEKYFIFHFATKNIEMFEDEESMRTKVKQLDFKGEQKLMTIQEYNKKF